MALHSLLCAQRLLFRLREIFLARLTAALVGCEVELVATLLLGGLLRAQPLVLFCLLAYEALEGLLVLGLLLQLQLLLGLLALWAVALSFENLQPKRAATKISDGSSSTMTSKLLRCFPSVCSGISPSRSSSPRGFGWAVRISISPSRLGAALKKFWLMGPLKIELFGAASLCSSLFGGVFGRALFDVMRFCVAPVMRRSC